MGLGEFFSWTHVVYFEEHFESFTYVYGREVIDFADEIDRLVNNLVA